MTGSAAVWISVGVVLAVVLGLGFVYRERLESWRAATSPRTPPQMYSLTTRPASLRERV